MSNQAVPTDGRSPYWGVPVARAVPALIVGVFLAFSLNHSSQVGLFVFGSYAITAGLLVALLSARFVGVRVTRRLFVAQGVVGVVLGGLALVFNEGGVPYFLYTVTLFGALTGFLELYAGLRSRAAGATSASRVVDANAPRVVDALAAKDWLAVGGFTAVLALVFLIIPLDIVTAVGLFGGYAVILAIFLLIGGFSLRWGHHVDHTAPLSQETIS
ncbi:hypothetical protein [Subtercola boreus]|uniref:DUF308 domain-containing protein n=1 Tax=Subtercola boreus TaxID=120213 RepID=A0A3E0WGN9_9MICO|nr:hypothetical protein [Subtercola boreus]RFA23422.1 hypothetical protein B7R24_00545 [Subtercola boreus]RFA23815.1 hypothetical protein B7R23_00545 [Subtercola boreus]RFA29516.1 hypothetical protein B7R25_00540 [Subtercola boreus]